MIESAVATALAAAGTAGIDELRRLRVISPALDALQPAPLADQPAAVLDGLLGEAFPLLTQPSSHVGSAATEAWRGVFTLAAVLRAAALLDNEHWAPAARLLDLALLLGNGGPQLAVALAPPIAQASASLRECRNTSTSAGTRRSPRLAALSLGAAASLPRVTEASAEELSGPPASALHVRGGLADWAALREGGWAASLAEVRARLGARTLPVEVGVGQWARSGRASEGRQQRLMRLDAFLDEQAPPDLAASPPSHRSAPASPLSHPAPRLPLRAPPSPCPCTPISISASVPLPERARCCARGGRRRSARRRRSPSRRPCR